MAKRNHRKEITNRQRRFDASKPVEPVVISATAPVVEPIHLFTITGENGEPDERYYMPGWIGPNLAVKVLERIEMDGEEAAMSYMLFTVLGEETHTALKNAEGMTPEQFAAISDIVMNRVMAALDTGN